MLSAKLVVVGGDAKRKEVNLKLPAVIGRGRAGVTLTLPHKLVSRQHTKIFERGGGLFVKDLGSLNGTFVNNERIDGERPLKPNELLTLGNVTFRAVYLPVESESAEPAFEEVIETNAEAEPKEVESAPVALNSVDPKLENSNLENSNDHGPSSDVIDDYLSDDADSSSSTDKSLLESAAAEAAKAAEVLAALAQSESESVATHQRAMAAGPETDDSASNIFTGDEIEGLSPEKSISMSAIEGLPTADNVSFKSDGLDLGSEAQPEPVVDQVEIDLDEDPKTPVSDNSKLGSFLKKLPR